MNRISIFVRKPVLWAQTPFFGIVGLFKDLESYHLQIWNLGSLAHYQTCEIIKCFKNRCLVPGRVIIFGVMWAQTPFFGLFYLKSYDDDIWYVGTLCDLEYECRNRISIFGLGPFFWRESRFSDFWFVQRLRVGLSARRMRVSIWPKAERFARRRRALCPRSACVIARRR